MKIVYLSSKVLTDTRQTREQLSDVLYDVTQIVKKKKKKRKRTSERRKDYVLWDVKGGSSGQRLGEKTSQCRLWRKSWG